MWNPMQRRMPRTITLFLTGLVTAWLVAAFAVPRWPGFCDDTIAGAPCEPVEFLTGFGYTTIILGLLTIVLGPIAGSLLHLAINGASWETPRGTETVQSNMPLLVGAVYLGLGLGVVIVASTTTGA
ncbi:MAG: hypothetical protein KDB69_03790 [Acidimicrobiia bacterium]|nr:hypothetical protein [Acidimicrobiia bacterium]